MNLFHVEQTPRLVVISGPERSGKMPLARALMRQDKELVLVHRDFLRTSFECALDEAWITLLMGDLARGILRLGRVPLIVAWNLDQFDRDLWLEIAVEFQALLRWLDVRRPAVAAMIPPLEQEKPGASPGLPSANDVIPRREVSMF